MIRAFESHDAHNDRENAASHDVLYVQVMMLIPRIHRSTSRQLIRPVGEQLPGCPRFASALWTLTWARVTAANFDANS
jgi:hypothetical protein